MKAFRMNRNTFYVTMVLFFCTIVSVAFTLIDPIAEWDAPIVTIVWLLGLTYGVKRIITADVVRFYDERIIIALAWVVRIVYVFLDNLNIMSFRGDDFFSMAWGLYYGYDHVIDGTYPVLTNYPSVLLTEFRVFGINRYVSCLVNAFFGMLAIYFLLKCFRILRVGRKIRIILLFIFAFNPFSIMFGSEVTRESIYIMFVTMSLYYYIKWAVRRKPIDLIGAFVLLIPVIWLHSGYAMIAGGYLLESVLYFRKMTFERLIYKIILLAILSVATIVILFTPILGKLSPYIAMTGSVSSFLDYFDMVQAYNNYSGSGSIYLEWMMGIDSLGTMVLYTPIRMLYFLVSPMMWDCYRIQDLLAFVTDSLVFLSATIIVLKTCISGGLKKLRTCVCGPVFIGSIAAVLFTAVPFAWGTFNSGTAIRHRNCLLPFICIQLAICLSLRKKKSKKSKICIR